MLEKFDMSAVVAALNKIKDAINNNFATPAYNETPAGSIDGSNKDFVIDNTPATNSLQVFLNGAYQTPGGEDYTLSNLTITFVNAPPTGSILRVFYYH